MADARTQDPVLLVVAAFSRHQEALDWSRTRLENAYGPIGLVSTPYDFNQTRYYESLMGPNLRKQFLVFCKLVPADCLADAKLFTNGLEQELAHSGRFVEPRPLNLDPGILSLGKFMLATMKDQAHRIYLRGGVFAEVTLRFQAGSFQSWPWTYADYRQPLVLAFMNEAREFYRGQLRVSG